MADADCIVVGGGIGGAVLALLLARQGRRVLILEREQVLTPATRPEILAQATIEVFDGLGLGQRMRTEAIVPLRALQLQQPGRGRVFGLDPDDLRLGNASPWSTDPNRTRQILLETAALSPNIQVRRGVEVHEVLREGRRIIGVKGMEGGAEQAWRAPLTVGDDGPRSRVRVALGLGLALRPFPFDFLSAVCPELPGGEASVAQAWIDPGQVRRGLPLGLFVPLFGARTAVVLPVMPHVAQRLLGDPATFYKAAARLSPRCADLAAFLRAPSGLIHIRRPFGHVARYAGDGAALLGDAAHPVTPVGGQGANMSVADAVVLAEVAGEALAQGDCSAKRLAAYERRRRPANARSLAFSLQAGRVFRGLNAVPAVWRLVPWRLRQLDRRPVLKSRLAYALASAFRSDAR